jgi:coenzyme Q-binding protein COQ10
MARYHVERSLPYTPDQLFELVGDVARYPEFVRWITHMDAGTPTELEAGITQLDAEASVGFSFLKERFATRVKRDAGRSIIDVSLISGPFKRLYNRWQFLPQADGTLVVFDIDFAFKSILLDAMLKANMSLAVDKLIACFEDRARAIYREPR